MSTLKADTITASDGSSAVTLTKQHALKHYHQYDQTNTTIDGSFNTSSISDDATGKYGINLTNATASTTDRAVTGLTNHEGAEGQGRTMSLRHDNSGSYTTTAYGLETWFSDNYSLDDQNHNFGMLCGDLA